jgi:hypothetical protein
MKLWFYLKLVLRNVLKYKRKSIQLVINLLTNLNSFGMFLYPKISYERFENVPLSLEFIKNLSGSKKDEFYFLPHKYLFLLRVNYYF